MLGPRRTSRGKNGNFYFHRAHRPAGNREINRFSEISATVPRLQKAGLLARLSRRDARPPEVGLEESGGRVLVVVEKERQKGAHSRERQEGSHPGPGGRHGKGLMRQLFPSQLMTTYLVGQPRAFEEV